MEITRKSEASRDAVTLGELEIGDTFKTAEHRGIDDSTFMVISGGQYYNIMTKRGFVKYPVQYIDIESAFIYGDDKSTEVYPVNAFVRLSAPAPKPTLCETCGQKLPKSEPKPEPVCAVCGKTAEYCPWFKAGY